MELTRECLYKHYIVQDKSEARIAKELSIGEGKADYWVRKYGFNFKRTDPDKVFNLKHINHTDPIFCYYAGLVATDGYLDYKNKRISLRVSNIGSYEVLENLRKYNVTLRKIDTINIFKLIYSGFEQYRFADKYEAYLRTVNR